MKLEFRTLSAGFLADLAGAEFPAWVQELRGKSGVYIIRQAGGERRVLYVGESHTGRLKKTLLRHFQAWSGKTAGQTYGRGGCEVAVIVTAPGKAVEKQNELICRLNPSDNTNATNCETDDPF